MRLARKNDDPVLLRDLQRLSGRGAGGGVSVLEHPDDEAPAAVASATATAGRAQDLEAAKAALSAFKRPPLPPEVEALGPFEQRFVRSVIHVRRFLPFYAGAGLWLFAMLLIQPLGGGGPASADLAGAVSNGGSAQRAVSSASTQAATATSVVDASPVFDDFGGSSVASTSFDYSSSAGSSFDDSDLASDSSSSSAPAADFDTPATFAATPSTSPSADKEPVSITGAGYASSAGGTPLEVYPADGSLPVHVTGGQVQRLSFIRLSGEETTLRLKQTGDEVNSASAVVQACVATSAWQPARGVAMSGAPKFDPARCAVGKPSSTPGEFEFDLSKYGVAADGNGYVLTAAPGDVPPTFQISFAGIAV